MRRLWLIGGREFKTYVATLSFWVALALGPLLTLAAFGMIAATRHEPAPMQIALSADGPALRLAAAQALEEASKVNGHPVQIGATGATIVRVEVGAGGPVAHFAGAPLPAPTRAVFKADLERRLALDLAARAGAPAQVLAERLILSETPARPAPGRGPAIGRFALMFMLWLTLTGSLGMLLQAVARERTNHALDILMAAARPTEIVFGKLLGVGAVSLLVMASWLGSAAAFGAAAGRASAGPAKEALMALADPLLLTQATGTYLIAYVMYGSVTIALGAAAKDIASAQNLSRPMFGILLLGFFAALASAMGAAQSLAWTVWLPPLTPFMLLLAPSDAYSATESLLATLLMCGSALFAGWIAKGSLSGPRLRRRLSILTSGAGRRAPTV